MIQLTPRSLELFLAYAEDAGNWGGTPRVGGNLGGGRKDSGNLTHLKKAGLITTAVDDGDVFIYFTAAGRELAAENGIEIPL